MSQINIPNINKVVDEYKILESKLKSKHPHEIEEGEKLADKIIDPSNTPVEKVWRSIWEKPLYSNTRVQTANTWIAKLEPYMKNSLNTWGEKEYLLITKTGKSGANTDFRFEGNLKSEINSLSIAYKRLYSIHCAAISLREMMDNNPYPLAFLMDEPMDQNYPFKKYMKQISFGYGWGAITKLHTMADLGCAVKPDLHLCRTIHHLGMCPEIPTSVENPKLEQSIIINLACMELLSELQKRFPEEGYRLRSLDYILMRISLNSLL
jgi:hypothetical protein